MTISIADPRLSGRAVRRIVYTQQQIAARVREIGEEIAKAYPDGDLLVLGLLKGSFIFLSDLVREIRRPLQIDFLVAASYGDAMVSSGAVKLSCAGNETGSSPQARRSSVSLFLM